MCRSFAPNFSRPGVAKRRENASCSSDRMLTPKTREPCSPALASERLSMQASTSGGSRLTEQNALTVSPSGDPASSRVVTTVTPVANCESARRNAEALMGTALEGRSFHGSGRARAVKRHLPGEQREPQRDAARHQRLRQQQRDNCVL